MAAVVILVGLVVIAVLAPFAGADSRRLDDRDRRGWMPTGRRGR